jgi:hypothetical protein
MKQVYLPKWVEPMADLHATSVVEDELGLRENDANYEKEYEKAFYNFCKELHVHSLTPYAMNPTWRGGINAFHEFEQTLFKGWIGQKGKDEKEQKELRGMVYRAITNLTTVYLRGEKKSAKFGYQYEKPGPDGVEPTQSKEDKKKHLFEQQKNRYERLVIVTMLLHFVEMVYNVKGDELRSLVDAVVKGENWQELSSKQGQASFAKMVHAALDKVTKGSNLINEIKKGL